MDGNVGDTFFGGVCGGFSRTFPPSLEVQRAVKGEEHLLATGLGEQLAQAGLGEPQGEEERKEDFLSSGPGVNSDSQSPFSFCSKGIFLDGTPRNSRGVFSYDPL